MRKATFFATMAILLIATTSHAVCTTTVPGGTISGETWTAAGSPYCVEGDLIINSLTIEPDVRVQFQGNYVFEVQGILTAEGTASQEIVFTGGESNDVDWQGILFNNSLPGSSLVHCKIEDSVNAGLRIENVAEAPNIDNCKILNNSRYSRGGGIKITDSGPVVLTECLIDGNLAYHDGGGHPYGGGIYVVGELSLVDCVVSNNISRSTGSTGGTKYSRGGGIYADGVLHLAGCFIEGNLARANGSNSDMRALGGGICLTGTASLVNTLVYNNEAYATNTSGLPGWGSAEDFGGGIYESGSSSVVDVMFTTITENTASSAGGIYLAAGELSVSNSIAWENTGVEITAGANVTYSDVQGGYPGEGNIDLNPVFIDEYHLDPTVSPCIDVGDPTAPGIPSSDIDGEARLLRCNYDMGLDEVPGDVCTTCNDGDSDGYGYPASIACPIFEWDCDDSNGSVNPGGSEVCGETSCSDGLDNDCDGVIDNPIVCNESWCPSAAQASTMGSKDGRINYLFLLLLPLAAIRIWKFGLRR